MQSERGRGERTEKTKHVPSLSYRVTIILFNISLGCPVVIENGLLFLSTKN